MADEVLSYFERRLLEELNRIATALESLRDSLPTTEQVDTISESLQVLPAIDETLTALDKNLSNIDGKIGR